MAYSYTLRSDATTCETEPRGERIVCQQSHQKGLLHVERHSSTSACHSALTAQTSLCSQFHCATNREKRCIMPSCYPNDVQIIFVQGSLSMAKRSHGSALQRRKRGRGKDRDMTHRGEISEMSQTCHALSAFRNDKLFF